MLNYRQKNERRNISFENSASLDFFFQSLWREKPTLLNIPLKRRCWKALELSEKRSESSSVTVKKQPQAVQRPKFQKDKAPCIFVSPRKRERDSSDLTRRVCRLPYRFQNKIKNADGMERQTTNGKPTFGVPRFRGT